MNREATKQDFLGNKFGETYSLILTDPTFEKRLKMFHQSTGGHPDDIKLMYDQSRKRWCVLEWAPDNSGWNLLLVCEDKITKEPRPVGDWIFNQLFVWRHNFLEKQKDSASYWDNLDYQAKQQRLAIDSAWSREHRGILADERNEWRKAWREINSLPVADVTAGYPKSTSTQQNISPTDETPVVSGLEQIVITENQNYEVL